MDDFEKYYIKALKFLSFRPRSEKEVKENLVKKKVPLEIVERIITDLKRQKFLNDEEFTTWWIESRQRFKPRSVRIIRMELKQKGIGNELVEAQIHNSESRIQNDLEQAKRLVRKKIHRYKDLPKQELYQKLGRFLASKGFNWDTIKASIDYVLKEGV